MEATRVREARLVEAARERGVRSLDASRLELVRPLIEGEATAAKLIARPRLVAWLARTPWLDEEKPATEFRRELAARTSRLTANDSAKLDRILRLYRHRELLRIALRDLSRRATLRSVTRELSHLADALLDAALGFWNRAGDRICILAMGKHGAEEVNYSSDVDVLFVADTNDLARATQVARHVIRSLSLPTADGFAFRVDANLRPYGRDGPLVSGPDELERYYERAGQTWERAALIKARPCAGDLEIGVDVVARLQPFVFRRSLDLDAVAALAQMKRRIDRARELSFADDVKLGQGGIREIEFFVQAMQLLHAGRQPRLRVKATLDALDALLYAGLVSADDRDALAAAYVFLRDVEHRLQLPTDQQTHALPPRDSPARDALAHRMGFADTESFESTLATHREAVRSRFSALLATASEAPRHPPDVDLALAADEPDDVRERALKALGFSEADSALGELTRLARQADGAFGPRGRERHPGLAERLLDEMSRSPSPDQALARFAHLSTPLWDPASLASLLAANAATARLLVLLFATSEALTRDFQLHPELLDALVRSDAALIERTRDDLEAELSTRLASRETTEEKLALLRRFRHEETLRIGLHDLAGRLDAASVEHQLSLLAEVLLAPALALAREEVVQRFGEPPRSALAVLGLGSFGGGELGYESDLDLVFVHDAAGATERGIDAHEWAARVFQKLLSHLTLTMTEGVLYRVDSRLRPSGAAGTLVTSLEAFGAYHRESTSTRGAALWERQALLRARFVAGDAELGERIEGEVLDEVMTRPLPPDAARQIAEMRRRLDHDLPRAIDPKKGPGGLLDVEFAVQSLELAHWVRVPSTRRALQTLETMGALTPEIARELRASYDALRRVESRLRLVYGRTDVFVPREGPGLDRLARQLGDLAPDGGRRLVASLERTMHRTRELFDALVR